jgi:hypothetical protein
MSSTLEISPPSQSTIASLPAEAPHGDQEKIPLPSVRSVIEDYKSRFRKKNECWKEGFSVCQPCSSSVEMNTDQKQLVTLLRKHNELFCSLRTDDEPHLVEKVEGTNGTRLYVHADFHGKLDELISELDFLQSLGLLDADYNCANGFKAFITGDFMDKGFHEIETLTLLLLMHMHNPTSFHLGRGDHENVAMNRCYSYDREFRDLLTLQSVPPLLTGFYRTLPEGFCFENVDTYQRIYLAHALFCPSYDLSPLLERNVSSVCIPKDEDLMRRFDKMAQTKTSPKQQAAIEKLKRIPLEGSQLLKIL